MTHLPASGSKETALIMPPVSEDGYIRLIPSQLKIVRLIHLISGLDEHAESRDATPTVITGYTEWISQTVPAITIGWDWQMQSPTSLKRISEPRSNVMLRLGGMDMGPEKTAARIETYIDSMEWQRSALDCIGRRYSG